MITKSIAFTNNKIYIDPVYDEGITRFIRSSTCGIENMINKTPISNAVFNSCKILYIPLLFSLKRLFTMLISLWEGTV